MAGNPLEAHVLAQRLVGRVDLQDLDAALPIWRRHEDLAVEAAGPKKRLVELLQQVRCGHDDDVVLGVEAVHLDEQLVERLIALAGHVGAALAADGVELVDEDDRGSGLARLLEEAADSRRAQAGEHLDERGGRLREESGAGLVSDRLRQQRLAGARRAVEKDALRHLGAEPLEPLRVREELDDLAKLVLGLVDAGDVVEGDGLLGLGADLLRLRLRHQPAASST